jgi:hypothetical protein
MTTAHTPGPWVALHEPTLSRWRIGAGFAAADSVAVIYATKVDSVTKANARLVAAAPAMLVALAIAEDFMSGFEDDEMQEGMAEKMAQIRAAIAAATQEG